MKAKRPKKTYYWRRKLADVIKEIEDFAYQKGFNDGVEEYMACRLDYKKRFGKIVPPTKDAIDAYLELNKQIADRPALGDRGRYARREVLSMCDLIDAMK